MDNMPEVADSYDERRKRMTKRLKGLSGKSATLKKMARKEDRTINEDVELARKCVYECFEEYEEGEYTWKQMVDEICKSLKAIKK